MPIFLAEEVGVRVFFVGQICLCVSHFCFYLCGVEMEYDPMLEKKSSPSFRFPLAIQS